MDIDQEENKENNMQLTNTPANLDLTLKKQAPLSSNFDLQFDIDRLKIYYDQIFPYKSMFKWLSYSKLKDIENRAF